MRSVGVREAKQQFARLLRRVEEGEEITITRNGRAVARLIPAHGKDAKARKKALDQLVRLMEKGLDLGGRRFTRDEMHED